MSKNENTFKNAGVDLSISPLLSRPIKERDYDVDFSGEMQQQTNNLQQNVQTPKQDIPIGNDQYARSGSPYDPARQQPQQNTGVNPPPPSYNAPPPPENIPEFRSEKKEDDEFAKEDDDFDSGGNSGFKLSEKSSKQFASAAVEMYAKYGTNIFYNMCRIDMNSVDVNVQNHIIKPQFVPVIERANEQAKNALTPDDEQKKMLKTALKDMLAAQNAKFANPTNTFLMVFGGIVISQIFAVRQIARENKQLLADIIKSSQGVAANYTPNYGQQEQQRPYTSYNPDTKVGQEGNNGNQKPKN